MRTNRARSRLQAFCRFVGFALATAFVLFSTSARADSRTTFLAERLKADDFRVRTNAALALGATSDEAAVQPLCGALSDSNEVVRQSAAAALKRLAKPSSLGCLKARLAVETTDSVKLQLTRAVESLDGAGGGVAPPPQVANAKYYVAISINNNTGRPQAEVDKVVLGAMQAKLGSLGSYQVAPRGEGFEAAAAVVRARKLKGFLLTVSVGAFDYSGGNLKVTIRVAVATYPGRSILGEMGPNAMMPGTSPGNHGVEDQLMEATAAQAVDSFAKTFQ